MIKVVQFKIICISCSLANNLDMFTLEFQEYGKNFIKSQKMSPDSYLQIAMQYAFYRYDCILYFDSL